MVLMADAVFAPGQRTVTRALRVMGSQWGRSCVAIVRC
jgi:hypothetical protein